jgi:putative SOS response-associated peptidase YedK
MRRSCYNARGETLFSKPAFRSAARDSRCLVPVTGFFEFREVSGRKFPYHIRMRDGRTFHLAGICEDTNLLSGGIERTFSIVTTEANELMSFVHNTSKRMPLVLPRGTENDWLGADSVQETLQEMVLPYPGDDLEAYPVTTDLSRRGGLKDPSDAVKRVNYRELEQARLDDAY